MNIQYAFIKDGIVVNTAVFDETPGEETITFFKEIHNLDHIILNQKNAIIGASYDGVKFWLPQPYPSWIKNEELNEWEAPTPCPEFNAEDPKNYIWNEDILNWEEVSE